MTTPRIFTIVPATPADGAVLAELHATSFPEPWTTDDFTTFLGQPGVMGWVCGAKHPEAFILIRRVAEEAEILTIAVRPAQRRLGYARTLVDHALETLRASGTAQCYLEVAVDNTGARALYEATGFVACAKRPGYYETANGRTDATVMRRDL
jgi:ribosomal-protein-alanine N-acetyltransferase